MDASPEGSRRCPWYKINANNTWPSEFFTEDEWAGIVEAATAGNQGTHPQLFKEIAGNFWELSEQLTEQPIEGEIPDTTGYVGANQLYYELKLHYTLMEQTTDAQKTMEGAKKQIDRIRGHFASNPPHPSGAGATHPSGAGATHSWGNNCKHHDTHTHTSTPRHHTVLLS